MPYQPPQDPFAGPPLPEPVDIFAEEPLPMTPHEEVFFRDMYNRHNPDAIFDDNGRQGPNLPPGFISRDMGYKQFREPYRGQPPRTGNVPGHPYAKPGDLFYEEPGENYFGRLPTQREYEEAAASFRELPMTPNEEVYFRDLQNRADRNELFSDTPGGPQLPPGFISRDMGYRQFREPYRGQRQMTPEENAHQFYGTKPRPQTLLDLLMQPGQ